MKDLEWFPPIPEVRQASAPRVLGSVVVGGTVGALLFWRGHHVLAIVAWVFAAFIALGLSLPSLRPAISNIISSIAHFVGRLSTVVVLWPFYFVVFGTARLVLSVARIDLLGLRPDADQPSYWRPAAPERKRARYYGRLFTVEPRRQESHVLAWATGLVVLGCALAVTSELILRLMGFGNPIVYRVDPRLGYYPAPHQTVHRYGGEIHINGFGMRSRDVSAEKPPGTFRILMLGDSTLYGGSYLDQSQMYSTRLETLLNQNVGKLPGSPRQVEVLCLGVNGWGPQHELAYIRQFGVFHADLVMVMGPPNDAYRPRYGIEAMPFFVEGHRPGFAWQEFWEHLLWETNLRLTGGGEGFEAGPSTAKVRADGVNAWVEIASLAQAQSAKVDFELLPNEDEAREGKAEETTQQVLDALLPVLATRQVAADYPEKFFCSEIGKGQLYHDGAHLDSLGHRVYATYLLNRVLHLEGAPRQP